MSQDTPSDYLMFMAAYFAFGQYRRNLISQIFSFFGLN